MTLPTFLVIGAMKAGTTTLYEHLRAHPDITMSADKEPDFFVAEKSWSRGLEWYESQFDAGRAVGEASTNYAKHPLFAGVAERATRVLRDVRVVYLVRHPLDRMRSHWLHAQSAGWETRSFAQAVQHDPQYVDVSRYSFQLEQWLAHVPAERIIVRTSEQMHAAPQECLSSVFGFVGVDPDHPVDVERRDHATAERPPARRPLARAASRVPGASKLARLAPASLRATYGRATTIPLDPEVAVLPPALEASIVERLRPDLLALRPFMPDDFDGWGLL